MGNSAVTNRRKKGLQVISAELAGYNSLEDIKSSLEDKKNFFYKRRWKKNYEQKKDENCIWLYEHILNGMERFKPSKCHKHP